MKTKDIPKKLMELHTAINEKIGKQCAPPSISISAKDNNAFVLLLWPKFEIKDQIYFHGDDAMVVLTKAHEHIANMPSQAELEFAEFQKDLADLIDKGREYSIDIDLNPLIVMSRKIASNAITKEQDSPPKTTTLMKPKQEPLSPMDLDDEIPFRNKFNVTN